MTDISKKMDPIVSLRQVSAPYGMTMEHPVNLEVFSGDRILIVGPSGSGKTSLLYVIAHFVNPANGQIFVAGEEHKTRAEQARVRAEVVSFVAQDAALVDHWPISMNLEALAGVEGAKSAAQMLSHWSVPHGGEQPRALSGGERQRVAVAGAVARRSPLIVADEPTSSLDARAKSQIVEALSEFADGTAVIVSSHDPVWRTWATSVLDLGGDQ